MKKLKKSKKGGNIQTSIESAGSSKTEAFLNKLAQLALESKQKKFNDYKAQDGKSIQTAHGYMDFIEGINQDIQNLPEEYFYQNYNSSLDESYTTYDPNSPQIDNLDEYSQGYQEQQKQKNNLRNIDKLALGTKLFNTLAERNKEKERERYNMLRENNLFSQKGIDIPDKGDYVVNTPGIGPNFRPNEYVRKGYGTKIAQNGMEVKKKVRIKKNAVLMQFLQNGGDVKSSISATEGIPNVEAEGNEQVVTPGNGIPENFTIKGPRHSEGGVPLSLEDESFIFSDNKKGMKIKDKAILKEFGVDSKNNKGYTPAELAKKYDINKYIKILNDPTTDDVERETAELMIKNYRQKLGKLALVQESMKGFEDGIPAIAMPYLLSVGISPEQIMPTMPEEEQVSQMPQQQFKNGGEKKKVRIYQTGGEVIEKNGLPYLYYKGQYIPLGHETLYEEKRNKNQKIETQASEEKNNESRSSEQNDNTEGIEKEKVNKNEIPEKYKSSKYKRGSKDFIGRYNLEEGDYIQNPDGSWEKVVKNPYLTIPNTYDQEFSEAGQAGERYAKSLAYLENNLSNPEILDTWYNTYKNIISDDEYYKRKNNAKSKKDQLYEALSNVTPEELASTLTKMQKINYKLSANDINPDDFTDNGDRLKPNLPEDVKRKYEERGITSLNSALETLGLPKLAPEDIAKFQAGYIALAKMKKNAEQLPKSAKQFVSGIKFPKIGENDEPLFDIGDSKISPIDANGGNTTYGQNLYAEPELQLEKVDIPEQTEEKKPEEIDQKPEEKVYQKTPAEGKWWLQDKGNLALATNERLGLKKYLPHLITPEMTTPDVVYYDPSRALANNAEQANIASSAISQQAGPGTTSRLAAIQAQANKNAANILGQYEDKNVQIANQYEDKVAQMKNINAASQAQALQNFFDQSTIANQQFDNSKIAANRNIFDAWRQGITNKQKTQALNSLFDHYQIIPEIGGGVMFIKGKDFKDTGQYTTGTEKLDRLVQLKKDYPTISDEALLEYAGFENNNKLTPKEKEAQMLLKQLINNSQ